MLCSSHYHPALEGLDRRRATHRYVPRFRDSITNFPIAFFSADHCNEWYFWLMALNSIMNPWIYLSLNRDLQMSLFYCCCPCFNNEEKQKPTAAAMTLGKPAALHESLKTSSVNLLRPRSFTASQAAVAGQSDLLKTRPFSNRSFLRQTNSGNEIPLMRCRLNTFQL